MHRGACEAGLDIRRGWLRQRRLGVAVAGVCGGSAGQKLRAHEEALSSRAAQEKI